MLGSYFNSFKYDFTLQDVENSKYNVFLVNSYKIERNVAVRPNYVYVRYEINFFKS